MGGGGSAVDTSIVDSESIGFTNVQEFADYILNQISNQQTSISNIINGATTVGNAANATNLNGVSGSTYMQHNTTICPRRIDIFDSDPMINFHFGGGDVTARIQEVRQSLLYLDAALGTTIAVSVDTPRYFQSSVEGVITSVTSAAPSNGIMLWAY